MKLIVRNIKDENPKFEISFSDNKTNNPEILNKFKELNKNKINRYYSLYDVEKKLIRKRQKLLKDLKEEFDDFSSELEILNPEYFL